MLRNVLLLVGIASAACFTTFACGGDSTNAAGSGGAGTGGGGTGAGTVGEQPPGRPSGTTPGDGKDTVFAIKRLYLGDTDRSGHASADAWKDFGYDLDGVVTNCTGTACGQITTQCNPAASGLPAYVYPDGNNGIDNSFGANILPIITGIQSDAASTINSAIADGKFTIMIDVHKLGAKSEYNPLTAGLYAGGNICDTGMGGGGGAAPTCPAPSFDGTDQWPLLPEFLNNRNPASPKVAFSKSYVVDNTWVSGEAAPVTLQLSIAGFNLALNIEHALLSFEMAPDHKSATNGVVAGVLNTEQLITELKQVAGSFDSSLCQGGTIDSVTEQIKQASDIMADGTAGPGKTCDGISIGLGFDAGIVQLGDVLPDSMAMGKPCK